MTQRNFTDKNGNSWSWEETKETQKALKELHNFAGNYPGPLYSPYFKTKDAKKID